jgi:hypothetical protein
MEISFGLEWIIFENFTHTSNKRDEMYAHTQLHYISVRAAENKFQVFELQDTYLKILNFNSITEWHLSEMIIELNSLKFVPNEF